MTRFVKKRLITKANRANKVATIPPLLFYFSTGDSTWPIPIFDPFIPSFLYMCHETKVDLTTAINMKAYKDTSIVPISEQTMINMWHRQEVLILLLLLGCLGVGLVRVDAHNNFTYLAALDWENMKWVKNSSSSSILFFQWDLQMHK